MSSIITSSRNKNVENPETGPKAASTKYLLGMWLGYDKTEGVLSQGHLVPLVPSVEVLGICLESVPDTDTTNDLITYDGVCDVRDRFLMPIANSGVGTFTLAMGSSLVQVGDIVTGNLGSTGRVTTTDGSGNFTLTALTGIWNDTTFSTSSGANGTLTAPLTVYVPVVGSVYQVFSDSINIDLASVRASYYQNGQFEITQVISNELVEVKVVGSTF